MVRSLNRLVRRTVVLALGVLTIWLIVFVFRFTDGEALDVDYVDYH